MDNYFINLDEFQGLTGIILDEAQQVKFHIANVSATFQLESLLGWSLAYEEIYNEVGKSKNYLSCYCPAESQIRDYIAGLNNNYLPADTPEGKIKLFPYTPVDARMKIDPATAIHSIKLVKVLAGSDSEFFTVNELKPDYWMQRPNNQNLIMYIEHCSRSFTCQCDCEGCLMLAVDANWMTDIPDDLKMVAAQLVLLLMNNSPTQISEEQSEIPGYMKIVKSESVTGHSVSYDLKKFNGLDSFLENPTFMNILKKYIGYYSPLNKKLRIL